MKEIETIDNNVSFKEILRIDEQMTLNLEVTDPDSFLTAASNSFDSLASDSCSTNLHLACTNARSIVEKLDSLATLFDECSLHFCLLTETWLTRRSCSDKKIEDLTLSLIHI